MLMLVVSLFKISGSILLQIAPWGTFRMAINLQTSSACEDVSEVSQGRFWELVPGHAVGCFSSSDLGEEWRR
uniref:Secreted protein n=1 Tax=Aegilops tauschii subsp. strangulata TaxID=200361 RepID=A0A453T4T9_AEGTS